MNNIPPTLFCVKLKKAVANVAHAQANVKLFTVNTAFPTLHQLQLS